MFVDTLLALMMLATAVAQGADRGGTYSPKITVATASVTILRAERITGKLHDQPSDQQDRQVRVRDRMSLVEFF